MKQKKLTPLYYAYLTVHAKRIASEMILRMNIYELLKFGALIINRIVINKQHN